MASNFEYFDHTADIGMKVQADSFEELLESAAEGFYSILIDTAKIPAERSHLLTIPGSNPEEFFMNLLRELLFLFSSEYLVFSHFKIPSEITEQIRSTHQAQILCKGSKVDLDSQEIRTEVKLITYHLFFVKKTENKWHANIIFDV